MSDRSETFALESLMEHARCREAGDSVGASVALLRVRALACARMWEAGDVASYTDLEFLADDMAEQAHALSLSPLDAVILGERAAGGRPLFGGEPVAMTAAQVLGGPRAKAQVEGDSEFACKNSLTSAPLTARAAAVSSPPQRSAAQSATLPDVCCGFPLAEHVTQSGENRGRVYRKCDVCDKWLGFVDDKPPRQSGNRAADDEDGAIRPARAGLGQPQPRSGSAGNRSGSAGRRQIKYPGPAGSNRAGSEEDSPVMGQAQPQNNAPDFQLASKRLKAEPSPNVNNNNGGGGGGGYGNNSNNSDRGSRSFNPARSVVDAINSTDNTGGSKRKAFTGPSRKGEEKKEAKKEYDDPIYQDERLKTVDPAHVENILSEIMEGGQTVTWEDISGLEFAKNSIKEMVVWPMLRPDIFTGLRAAPKGLLLFGPPGTGKTMIGKAIAHEARATFFAISASILTSKWIGEGEKMVRALFAVARIKQPSVIFIDEIDSLLTARSDNENEATRRIKTEFLVQLDGVANGAEERLLLVGATNRPQELDEAARRRLTKRLYIPLPEPAARRGLTKHLLRDQQHLLSEADLDRITQLSEGYSGADIKVLCSEASMGPIRDLPDIMNASKSQVRSINMKDFEYALRSVRASVAPSEINAYLEWNTTFGTVKG